MTMMYHRTLRSAERAATNVGLSEANLLALCPPVEKHCTGQEAAWLCCSRCRVMVMRTLWFRIIIYTCNWHVTGDLDWRIVAAIPRVASIISLA